MTEEILNMKDLTDDDEQDWFIPMLNKVSDQLSVSDYVGHQEPDLMKKTRDVPVGENPAGAVQTNMYKINTGKFWFAGAEDLLNRTEARIVIKTMVHKIRPTKVKDVLSKGK